MWSCTPPYRDSRCSSRSWRATYQPAAPHEWIRRSHFGRAFSEALTSPGTAVAPSGPKPDLMGGNTRASRFISVAVGLGFVLMGCRNRRGEREVAADGKRHYLTYNAAGEVTLPDGEVNIYEATGAGALSPAAARAKPLVYVPNSRSASVTVIDPVSHTIVRTFPTGRVPQH